MSHYIKILGKEIYNILEKAKWNIFLFQVAVSFFTFGISIWQTASIIKKHLLGKINFNLNPWADIFFNPLSSSLLNYILFCAVTFIFSAIVYFNLNSKNIDKIKNNIASFDLTIQILILVASVLVVCNDINIFNRPGRLAITLLITFAPLLVIYRTQRIGIINCNIKSYVTRIAVLAIAVLVSIVSLESINVLRGPTYLMNEFDIPSETLIGFTPINNSSFLADLPDDILNKINIDAFKTSPGRDYISSGAIPQILFSNKLPISRPLTSTGLSVAIDSSVIKEFGAIDPVVSVDFYYKNLFQYQHYNMSRGQVNHIGTILNPLGALELGKSLKNSYIQYGMGNTLLFKRIMELFGGVSLQNYYKCYILYVIYTLSFLLMLCYVFKDAIYVMAGISVFTFAYFYQEYVPFIFAPGIIPSIHLLDAPAVALFLSYVKNERLRYLVLLQVVVALAVFLNTQFGFSLLISSQVALMLYHLEIRQKDPRKWCASLIALFVSLVLFRYLSSGTQGETFKYFVLGFFSWPAKSHHIFCSVILIVTSYIFLFMLRHSRHYLKYVFVMLFAYVQCLLLYFYWSGLSNHLPTVLPFLGVEILLMLFILQHRVIDINKQVSQKIVLVIGLLAVLLIANTTRYVQRFYHQKMAFLNNFVDHTVFNWDFDRARVVTTINDKPIRNGIDLINKYSTNSKGIYLISRYDNILPFLAKRYSFMPFYEMTWRLISEKETNEAVNLIKNMKPNFIFVDTDILEDNNNMWEKLYSEPVIGGERASRVGRYEELRKVYDRVSDYYERIESGHLISVYRLKTMQ